MPVTKPPSSSTAEKNAGGTPATRKRLLRPLIAIVLVIAILVAWLLINNSLNSTEPSVTGRPLSNPHTHLHTVALGGRPGEIYLGTHYGMFTSTDEGQTWPQPRGVLNTMMITAIAVSPANPDVLGVMAIPVSGIGVQSGVYFSHDGGASWHASAPSGLAASAYPYTIKAGAAGAGDFYAFYNYAGWFETRDLGAHWYPITSGILSNMQTPSLLVDPADPAHLLLGGDQGLYESKDDGGHWNRINAVKGNVYSIAASNSTPRLIFCATDQGIYRWNDGSIQITQLTGLPTATPPTRIVSDGTGHSLYALAGQDLWYSADSGTSWKHLWHFDRGDLVSLVVDPRNPAHLYAGFFLPGEVLYSDDGGSSWQILTN
jgi:photosystem II stability/assembly factor-like uncharacterized protein